MTEPVSAYLLTQGALGVAVLVLGFVVAKLYSKVERLEQEKTQLLVTQNTEVKKMLVDTTSLGLQTAQSLAILTEKIEVNKRYGKDS